MAIGKRKIIKPFTPAQRNFLVNAKRQAEERDRQLLSEVNTIVKQLGIELNELDDDILSEINKAHKVKAEIEEFVAEKESVGGIEFEQDFSKVDDAISALLKLKEEIERNKSVLDESIRYGEQ